MDATTRGHAVVLGGSVAGLLSARVLAEAYDRVTIVERDAVGATADPRRGVPHGRHLHALLARGQQIAEELLPGLTAGLVADGAPAGDLLADVRWNFNGHRFARVPAGLPIVCVRRPVLEAHIRSRVLAWPNVTLLERHDVLGLSANVDGRRVTGARVLSREDGSAATELAADLVVDATGRGSRTPVWLGSLGYEPPPEEQVRVRVGYATRLYRLPPDALHGDLVVTNGATVANPRSGVLELLGQGEAMVSLMGRLGDDPPTDPAGFVDFARSLQFPDIHAAIADAEPLGDPVAFRFPASVRRRYERLRRFPAGFLVTGDAACSFNPIYAQGMSVAALEALELRRALATGAEPDGRRFFRAIASVIDGPWAVAAGGDLAFPGVEGRRTAKARLVNRYIARLHATAAHDPFVAEAFIRAAGLVDRPPQLLRPTVARRVLLRRPSPAARVAVGRQAPSPSAAGSSA